MTTKNQQNIPTVFNFGDNEVRTMTDKDNNPLFVARDIAIVLGYEKPNNAIIKFCKGASNQGIVETNGGKQKLRLIKEPDVYRLIFGSKLKSAIDFQDFIFNKVLPQLRKTGSYSINDNNDKPTQQQAFRLNHLTRNYAHLEDVNDECYIVSTDIVTICDMDHDQLLDELVLFGKKYKNHYNPNKRQIELIIQSTRNKKPVVLVYHSAFLAFAKNTDANLPYITNTINKINEFYDNKYQELEKKNKILNNNTYSGIYFMEDVQESIKPILNVLKEQKQSNVEPVLKQLQNYFKTTYPKDQAAPALLQACLDLAHNENGLIQGELAQISNHINNIEKKVNASYSFFTRGYGDVFSIYNWAINTKERRNKEEIENEYFVPESDYKPVKH